MSVHNERVTPGWLHPSANRRVRGRGYVCARGKAAVADDQKRRDLSLCKIALPTHAIHTRQDSRCFSSALHATRSTGARTGTGASSCCARGLWWSTGPRATVCRGWGQTGRGAARAQPERVARRNLTQETGICTRAQRNLSLQGLPIPAGNPRVCEYPPCVT